MRGLLWSAALLALLASFTPRAGDDPWTVLIGGDTAGYLSPCGCTKPMTGGIRRRATAVRKLGGAGKTLVLDNGGLVSGVTRQDELKAETLAEALHACGTDAIQFGGEEAAMGRGMLEALQNLSGGRMISTSVASKEDLPLNRWKRKGPFLVGAAATNSARLATALGATAVNVSQATADLVQEAKTANLIPILLLRGSKTEAHSLARSNPDVRLIAYSSTGSPDTAPSREGRTILVSPGERGRHLIRLRWTGSEFESYEAVSLGEDYADDTAVGSIYRAYLGRVGSEQLLNKAPRSAPAGFAGTKSCVKCHASAGKVWEKSAHAMALKTLEIEGHELDPDCVGCHVVGLAFKDGFRSRTSTPNLANVGCESCHGAGAKHALAPTRTKMPRAGAASCQKCHNPDHSPNFSFSAWWKRIRH